MMFSVGVISGHFMDYSITIKNMTSMIAWIKSGTIYVYGLHKHTNK